ncbi:hypothetical protein AVEN_255410-1 [Araneus ventricosus]|uniref:Uncharacterized protein n=1 Tax=Araneus ventricosus TaxID=182803 RepID=A0A4Y2J0B6_ARAVE|nr:hypothetical protein AVEN_255410-1 [Araneus ventricosus]
MLLTRLTVRSGIFHLHFVEYVLDTLQTKLFFISGVWKRKEAKSGSSDGSAKGNLAGSVSEALKESKARKNNPHRLQIFCCQRECHSQKETFQPASPSPTQLLGLICEGRGW